jgi:hypothetical protein
VVSLGIPRTYLAQGKPDRILARLGLDGPGLARSVREAVRGTVGHGVDPADTKAAGTVSSSPTSPLPAAARAAEPLD